MYRTEHSVSFPETVRDAIPIYLNKGLAPIPLPVWSKNPGFEGWQYLKVTAQELDAYFPPDSGVGILNGEPSGNHLDVDLDCPQAIQAAPLLLPPTGWVFGRASTPRSHRIYRVDRPLTVVAEEF
jgi:hypothetical protein